MLYGDCAHRWWPQSSLSCPNLEAPCKERSKKCKRHQGAVRRGVGGKRDVSVLARQQLKSMLFQGRSLPLCWSGGPDPESSRGDPVHRAGAGEGEFPSNWG